MKPTSLPILYSFKRCPYAIRARMALAFAHIQYIHREIDLKNKHAEFLATSPKGTVPVFIDGQSKLCLEESYDIVTYALDTHLPQGWIANTALAQPYCHGLLQTLSQAVIPAIRKLKYGEQQHNQDPETIATVNQYLYRLNDILASQDFLLDGPSALDILIFPNLRQLIIHDPAWLATYDFRHVANWLQRWTEHPVFKMIFVSHPVWTTSQTPILTPNNHQYRIF